jgi:hypothetical protein
MTRLRSQKNIKFPETPSFKALNSNDLFPYFQPYTQVCETPKWVPVYVELPRQIRLYIVEDFERGQNFMLLWLIKWWEGVSS